MASFLLSEVYIVERTIASGHSDLEDLTCESTVCTSEHQAYWEAIKNMLRCAMDNNCDKEEEESLRHELAKTMRRRGITMERRYTRLKDLIIGASRAFNAEQTYYTVKRSAIVPHEEIDEEAFITKALEQLEASIANANANASCDSPVDSTRNLRQASRDPPLRGHGRDLPPLPVNEEGLRRKRGYTRNPRQPPREPSVRGYSRVLTPLPVNEEGLTRRRAGSTRKPRQASRDPPLRGYGRYLPPLPVNEEGLRRKRAYTRNPRQVSREPSVRGCGRVLPPLAVDDEGLTRERGSPRNLKQALRDPPVRGCDRVLPPLPLNDENLARNRAYDLDWRPCHNFFRP